jgi:hypothetical protein
MGKYDIGIYTFWNVPNYGTFAQAYALQRIIQKMFPDRDVRQIAYLDDKHYNFYYSRVPVCKPWHLRFYKEFFNRNRSSALKKCSMFLNAYNTISHTEKFTRQSVCEASFDTVIVGSDIIWDYTFECFNNDPLLFGNNFNARIIGAYAGSFGTVDYNQNHPDYVKNGLRRMKAISVRDKKSFDIVKSITGNSPEIVLDPTWLWDFAADPNIVKAPYKDYMIVYGQDFTDEFIKQIIAYANKRQLKLICLDCNNDNYDWCEIVLKQYELSPYEWIGLFRDATTIATTTFHGLTFSLIFNKQFAFCKTEFILAKAGTFLQDLGLYDRFTESELNIEKMIEVGWDYQFINHRIDVMRKRSFDYLRCLITDKGESIKGENK